MGMFDTVYVNCPNCNSEVGFQSKGEALPQCNSYSPSEASNAVLLDAEGAERCSCGQWIALQVDVNCKVFAIEEPLGARKDISLWFAPIGFDVRDAILSD